MSQLHLIEKHLSQLPWYVKEYINYKGRSSSENTLVGYCRDFKIFFEWLCDNKKFQGEPKEVPLSTLESLRSQDVFEFESFCSINLGNATDTIARKISALKSLFHYLSQIAEDIDLYPYLKRNVMAKIEVVREKYTEMEKAERISGRILIDQEIDEFREFVAYGYGEAIKENKRKWNAYQRNKERDVALVSLILGSGMRISEVISLDIDKVDWNNQFVLVRRKGGKHDKIVFSDVAFHDLVEYKKIRDIKYSVSSNEKALFLSSPTGTGKSGRLRVNSAQKMIEKYAEAFGKATLTVHKLRHTFATQYYQKTKDLNALKRQLGHSNINTTVIYTHVLDNTLKDAVNKADE